MDIYGRKWPHIKVIDLCFTCGQPDFDGSCNHNKLSVKRVEELDGILSEDKNFNAKIEE